ncbi:MAG: CoA pyrophosphatase [Chloroflexi bacterium]|nr:CoA pyrophosphatase [Chloroflexota bacterium]
MTPTRPVSIETIRRAMAQPRPGFPAQLQMWPPDRPRMPAEIVNPNHGGVLVLLYPRRGQLHFVLTLRTSHLDHHKGQIAFPGGAHEAHDTSYSATAFREAREELGINLKHYEVLGELTSLYIGPSNFWIYPTVCYCLRAPVFHPDPREVAEVIEVPLPTLLDPQTRVVEEWTMNQYGGVKVMMPYYAIGHHKVWGATAMVLAELVVMIREELEETDKSVARRVEE